MTATPTRAQCAPMPSAMPLPPSLTEPLAAIDLGSNSFRLEIGRLQHGRYRRIDDLKEMVRLGGGLDEQGMLTDEAAERGLACLRRFAVRLQDFDGGRVRAVATQTLREARNRNAFLVRGHEALGHAIEVISGREEARLIYAGVAHLQPSQEDRLVVDIGGRSTEMILGHGDRPGTAESFQVGCVSLSMRYFPGGVISAEGFRAAQVAAGAELEEGLQPFAPRHWRSALGASGTVGAVAQILAAAGVSDGRITAEGLRWCIARCIELGHVERLQFAGLKPERRQVLPGGLAILYTLLSNFRIPELTAAKGALRQGVIVDLQQRRLSQRKPSAGDLRDASVAELQRRFAVDTAHAERVAAVAAALYQQACPDADAVARRELRWACALHEMGQTVSHHDHHRHSAYLMAHVDAPGFSQSQQRRIGELVLGQRGGLRKIEQPLAQTGFAWQVLCLRLAVIACHARLAVSPHELRLHPDGNQARLGWKAAWAAQHERTVFLLQEEALAWQRHGPLRLLLPA